MKGFKDIQESFKTKQVKYGGYAAVITIAVVIALILLNLMMGQLAPQIDLTWSGLFSLTEQTQQVLEQLNTPIKFYGLWRPDDEDPQIMDIINLYLTKSRHISFEVLDPNRNPGLIARYDRDRSGIPLRSLIVEGDKGFRIIPPVEMYDISQNQQGQSYISGIAAERRITNAIQFVGIGTTPVIYELTGQHNTPLGGLRELTENYVLKELNLMLSPVPDDASVIILHSPQRDLTHNEAELLLDYLRRGGRFFVMADYYIRELPNLNMVLASYGIAFNYGIVRETDPGMVTIDSRISIVNMADHEIFQSFNNRAMTPPVLAEAMPITELETRRRSIEIKPLMTTSGRAYLRTDISDMVSNSLPSDVSGPFTLAVTVTDPYWIEAASPQLHLQRSFQQTRIVAIGCATLLDLAHIGFDTNMDIFLNSLNWLQDRPASITVRSKSVLIFPLQLNRTQTFIFSGVFIAVIPLAFFIAGLIIWLKRRHL